MIILIFILFSLTNSTTLNIQPFMSSYEKVEVLKDLTKNQTSFVYKIKLEFYNLHGQYVNLVIEDIQKDIT